MIDNPQEWYYECGDYAIDNKYNNEYGFLFLIDNDAPEAVKKTYKKYLELCIKPFLSNGIHIVKNGHIDGFEKTDSPALLEQIELFYQLVQMGYINNDVFPPKVI